MFFPPMSTSTALPSKPLPVLLLLALVCALLLPRSSTALAPPSALCFDARSFRPTKTPHGKERSTLVSRNASARKEGETQRTGGDNQTIDQRHETRDAFALISSRRTLLAAATAASATAVPGPASAAGKTFAGGKSRTEGYAVQRTEREWAYVLSGPQYNILRRGGTERQKSSVLNTFTAADAGTYACAACAEPLFASAAKFNSGTGWPSFAAALEGVETEEKDLVTATLGGREVRCATCGGHLGDLFNDGRLYVGTAAFASGNRYCIDGAALVFRPEGGGDDVPGDVPPPNKVIQYEPSAFRDQSINGRLQQQQQ